MSDDQGQEEPLQQTKKLKIAEWREEVTASLQEIRQQQRQIIADQERLLAYFQTFVHKLDEQQQKSGKEKMIWSSSEKEHVGELITAYTMSTDVFPTTFKTYTEKNANRWFLEAENGQFSLRFNLTENSKWVNERFTDTRGWMTNNAKKFTLQYIKTHSNVDNMPFVGEVETNQQRKVLYSSPAIAVHIEEALKKDEFVKELATATYFGKAEAQQHPFALAYAETIMRRAIVNESMGASQQQVLQIEGAKVIWVGKLQHPAAVDAQLPGAFTVRADGAKYL